MMLKIIAAAAVIILLACLAQVATEECRAKGGVRVSTGMFTSACVRPL